MSNTSNMTIGRATPDSLSANPSGLERLRRHLREEGVVSTIARLVERVVTPIALTRRVWVGARRLDGPLPIATAKVACDIRKAQPEDLDRLAAVGFYGRAQLAELLTSPTDACFIAVVDGRVVSYLWMSVGPSDHGFAPLPWIVRLAPGHAYVYNSRALRGWRGLGVSAAVGAAALAWLAQQGIQLVYVSIRDQNAASLRLFTKLGFQRLEHVTMRRRGRAVTIECHRPRRLMAEPIRVLVVGDEARHESSALAQLRRSGGFRIFRAHDGAAIRRSARGATDVWLPQRRGPLARWRRAALCSRLVRQERVEIVHAAGLDALELIDGVLPRSRSAASRSSAARPAPRVTVGIDMLPAELSPSMRRRARRLLRRVDRVLVQDPLIRRRVIAEGLAPESVVVGMRLGDADGSTRTSWSALWAPTSDASAPRAGRVSADASVRLLNAEALAAGEADHDEHDTGGWAGRRIGYHGRSYAMWTQLAELWRDLVADDLHPSPSARWRPVDGRGSFPVARWQPTVDYRHDIRSDAR
jgi:ribosomal protein S18 acetylase RimI-like enzyme